MSREDDWNRVSALAGLDPEGGIAPPPPGVTINRDPHPFWKTKDYSVTETPAAEHSAIDLRMKLSEIAPSAAAALWGSPGVITAMNEYFNAAITAERERHTPAPQADVRGFKEAIEQALEIVEHENTKLVPGGPVDVKGLLRDIARQIRALDTEGLRQPNVPVENRPEWIWYCESTSGVPVVTFGRWAKQPQQARYKLADTQPTEHDHPSDDDKALGKLEPIQYALHYGGSCRDCADADGVCPLSGLPCEPAKAAKAVQHCLKAWQYGIEHGYMENPFPSSRASGLADGIEKAAALVDEMVDDDCFPLGNRHRISASIRALADPSPQPNAEWMGRLVRSARALLAHFNPTDLPEDASQQWEALNHLCSSAPQTREATNE